MRSLLLAVTAALLAATAACDPSSGGSPAASTPTPTRSAPARTSPTPKPVSRGTVANYDTRFRVSVASVRTVTSFAYGGEHERAKAGERLAVIMITARNIGKHPSRIDWANQEPVDLAGADGRTYYPRKSFGRSDVGVFPGRSLTEPYVFPVPAGTKPAYAIVTLFGGVGFPSTVNLALP